LPAEMKKLRGTYRPSRDRSNRVSVAPAHEEEYAPSAPLREEERAIFDSIVADMRLANTLSPIYRRAITHLARLEYRAEKMRDGIGQRFLLRERGPTGRMDPVKNPAISQLSDLEKQIAKLYHALGLTPEGILRVPKVGGASGGNAEGANSFWEGLGLGEEDDEDAEDDEAEDP